MQYIAKYPLNKVKGQLKKMSKIFKTQIKASYN